MDDFNIADILEEIAQPDFLPAELEPTKTAGSAVSAPEPRVVLSAEELANVMRPRIKRQEPPPEVFTLPANPTKSDLAQSILSNVEKEFGTIVTHRPAKPVIAEPIVERHFRSGDIIHKRLLNTPAASGRKGDYIGRVTAEQQRLERRRERRKMARETAIAQHRQTAEDDAKYLFEAFYSTKTEESVDTTKRLGPIIEQAIEEGKRIEKLAAERSKPVEPAMPIEDDTKLTADDVYYRYAARADSLRIRTYAVLVVCLIMGYFTIAASLGGGLPSTMKEDQLLLTMMLTFGQLLVTLIGIDVIVTGVYDILKFKPGTESLTVIASIATFADAIQCILRGEVIYGTPYSLTVSVMLLFAMYGTRLGKSAYNRMLKTIAPLNEKGRAVAIFAEWEKVDNGIVLSKSISSPDGFLHKATRSDCSETTFGRIAPLLMIAAPLLAALSAISMGKPDAFARIWAAITCGASAFGPLLAFNLPFNLTVKHLASNDIALAAWEGASDIAGAIGLVVKDGDLFKMNALRLSSFKVAQKFSAEQVVLYTASMIMYSGSGLVKIFRDLLNEYGMEPAEIRNFEVHDGGGAIAVIGGDKVCFGSEAFMRLMNVPLEDVPTKIGGAVFLAINGFAAGVFIMQYSPSEKVQRALLRMSKFNVNPMLATRDVNITPTMLRSKFKLDLMNLEFPPYGERYTLSDESAIKAKPSALMSQDSLSTFADVAEAGKWLYNRARFSSMLSALSSIIGAFAMFFLCYTGAFAAASPTRALLFHLVMAAVVIMRSIF
ncbi:MAG: DUF1206 domain-containing protein [Oscillospiraceae bacterium]|jgi:hypothetical protein|nr:DUF1206 domain-containing protein [Oscillospiraceae bacterium]